MVRITKRKGPSTGSFAPRSQSFDWKNIFSYLWFKMLNENQKAAVLNLGAFSQAKDSASLTVSDRKIRKKPSHIVLLRRRQPESTCLRPTISFVSKKHSMTSGRTARPRLELKTQTSTSCSRHSPRSVLRFSLILAHVLSYSHLGSRPFLSGPSLTVQTDQPLPQS